MRMCPESKKYIVWNIIFQFIELCCSAAMIVLISFSVQNLYVKVWGAGDLVLPLIVIALTVVLRFFTTRYATRMSFPA